MIAAVRVPIASSTTADVKLQGRIGVGGTVDEVTRK